MVRRNCNNRNRMRNRYNPIGLFDSGIGGLSILSAVQRRLPSESLLYLADQAHCPYGSRSTAELRALTIAAVRWLHSQQAKLIVIACNSASAAALEHVRAAFPATPIVGMVPAVKPAVYQTRTGVIGVLATEATITGGLLQQVVAQYAAGTQVLLQPCPGLADAIEEGAFDHAATRHLIAQYVTPLVAAGADTLVLGCTHYPLVAQQIQAIAGDAVTLIDPAPAIAEQTARLLERYQLTSSADSRMAVRYVTTGDYAEFATQVARLQMPDWAMSKIEDVAYAI
jgi:glutamate racemase